MTVNVLPELAASIFGIILARSLRLKYTDATEANVHYRQLVYSVTLATATDVICVFLQEFWKNIPVLVLMISTTVFYLATLLAGFCLFRYVAIRAGKENKTYFRIQSVLLAADSLLLVLNLFTRTVFDYDADGNILYGRFHLVIAYGVAFWFLLASIIVQGIHGEKEKRLERVALRFCGLSLLVAFIIQFFFLREVLFSFAVGMLSVYLVFFAVEMPVYVRLETATRELLLKQEEANRAAKKALRASRAKSNFLANTSHEIRTPMNAILGMNDMIEQGTSDIRVKAAAGEIKSAGESLLQIINDVLEYSRIESGITKVTNGSCSLGTMLAEIDDAWRDKIEAKEIVFETRIKEDVPDAILCDREKLKMGITHLVSNAYKYTESGAIRIRVSVGVAGENRQLLIAVKDTGIGIREAELAEVFSPFTRAALEENRDKQGTGLGLKLTDELARLMGGSVRAESTYGKGSRFTIRLPLHTMPQEDTADAPAKEVYEQSCENLRKQAEDDTFSAVGKRVLIVDDTVVNLTIYKRMVELTGASADTCMSGKECLTALRLQGKHPYDLVFLDYMMPEMDGIMTLELLRMIPSCNKGSLPVIAMTASIDDAAAYHFLQAGFDDYLPKPVKQKDMQAMLKKHLSGTDPSEVRV